MVKEERTPLFSVTAKDCDWSYTKGSGKGGQKKNKTSSAVHCKHRDSGARGYAEDSRSQHDNKRTAFKRMIETKEFKNWHMLEVSRHTGERISINERVNRAMRPKNLKTEIRVGKDKWVEVDEIPRET